MKIDFDHFIDPELAERLLNVTLGDKLVNQERLAKAFYTFDFNTSEGITTFLSVLPVMDTDVVMQAQEQLLPGTTGEHFDVQRARMELRGYLTDVLLTGLVSSEKQEEALEDV